MNKRRANFLHYYIAVNTRAQQTPIASRGVGGLRQAQYMSQKVCDITHTRPTAHIVTVSKKGDVYEE